MKKKNTSTSTSTSSPTKWTLFYTLFCIFLITTTIVFIHQYSYAISKTMLLLKGSAYPSDLIQSIMKRGMAPVLNEEVPIAGGYLIMRLPMDNLKMPTIVTNRLFEFPSYLFHKKGSVPQLLIDVAKLDPHGTSVFLENLDDRGPNNQRKVAYMNAMTPSLLAKYRLTIHRVLRDPDESLTLLDRIMIITWELHFDKKPCPYAIFFMDSFRKAFSDISLHGIWTCRQDYMRRKPEFAHFILELVKEAPPDTMAGAWKHDGVLTNEDIVVEISHNILAMTMQWFLVSRRAPFERKYATSNPSKFFNRNAFAPSITSLNKAGNRIVAQIAASVSHKQCPYISSATRNPKQCPINKNLEVLETGEIIPRGSTINVAEEFLAFGKGYRRCAGEVLTHIYLEEFLSCNHEIKDPDLGNVQWGFTRTH